MKTHHYSFLLPLLASAPSAFGQATPIQETDAFNIYRLSREDLVRQDNPRIKPQIKMDWLVDEPPVIDKRDYRTPQSMDFKRDEAYVHFKPESFEALESDIHARRGAEVVWRSEMVPGLCKVRFEGDVPAKVNAYLDEQAVLYAEPNYRMSKTDGTWDDPLRNLCWGMIRGNPGTSYACDAWADHATGALVAIIDTGTDIDHEDLAANIWTNPGEIPGNFIDDDLNGKVDDVHGWNVSSGNGDVDNCEDDHGTHVAGIVSARAGNDVGMQGVAPFGKLMILKCNGPSNFCGPNNNQYDPCCGLFNTVEAVDYAIANGARISNNSYGSLNYIGAMNNTILAGQAVGHLFVASAGNGAEDGIGDNNDLYPHYPDGYPLGNIISVAAIEADSDLTGFSNYGATSVDIGAPGSGIYGTLPGNNYGPKSGTSMAAPMVAGAAALILGKFPDLTWSQVKTRILDSALPTSAMSGICVSGGQLDVSFALGVWVDPANVGSQYGSFFDPYFSSSMSTAYSDTPQEGTLNFKPGTIPLANVNFTWDKPMTVLAEGGTITLGN